MSPVGRGEVFHYGGLSGAEHALVLKAIADLRQVLLDEIGSMASQKLSRKERGAFQTVALEGRRRLEEIKILNQLHDRLVALAAEAPE